MACTIQKADSRGLLVRPHKEKEEGKAGDKKTGGNPVFECL